MTLVDLQTPFVFPFQPGSISNTPTTGAMSAINTAGQQYAYVFQAKKSGNISKVGFTATVTTGTTTCDIRIESIDTATGNPSGTLKGTNANANLSLTTSGRKEVTLTAPCAVTQGDWIAIVIVPSGTFNFTVAYFTDSTSGAPYCERLSAGTWSVNFNYPIISVIYDDGSNGAPIGTIPILSYFPTPVLGSADNPNNVGMKITMPFTGKIDGVQAWLDADGDYDVVVYDTDGTTQLAVGHSYTNTPPGTASYQQIISFTSKPTLTAGSTYYVAIKPTTTTQLTFHTYTMNDAAYNMNSFITYSQSQNPTGVGSRTDFNTRLPFMGLLVSQVDVGGGSSSVATGYSFMV